MYLGYLILQDNFKILIGRSLPAKYTNQIREYIESRDEILKVFKIKSKNLDSQCYSIAVDLSYDPKYISSLILEELKSDIAKTPPSASEEVKRLISKSIEMVLLKEVELNEKLKKEIRDKFPDVVEVDIESKSK